MPTPEEDKAAGYFDVGVWGEKDVKGAYPSGSEWELPDGSKIDPSLIPDVLGGEGRKVKPAAPVAPAK